jgi:ADP-heptose:LPS heptosyltransferase
VLDTAAVMRGLDLIITVDTLTAHLAGTLGIPTWVLHRYCREWRWGDQGEASVWYPSVRSWTQAHPSDWDELLMRVRTALEQRANK